MGNYFVPSKGVDSWRELVADPTKQWKPHYSAYELAKCWEEAENIPANVKSVLENSHNSIFNELEILYGFPEYKVKIPGGGGSSQNDLYLLAKSGAELLTIMVEGKASEPFGKEVRAWIGQNPSEGKKERLKSLLELLNLNEEDALDKRYQLFHRTASAMLEAKKVNAKHALVLIHSFSADAKWFQDYQSFVEMFGITPEKETVVGPVMQSGVNLYFGWVTERLPEKTKKYFYSLFKTDKAKRLAEEIDDYLYNGSPYKYEVEDYHDRENNGVRTDCIGYISKKGSYKFATTTSKRGTCFVLHLGKKLHTHTAKTMQRELDELLGHAFEDSHSGRPTPGEVYIKLEWVDSLEQIKRFIDEAYKLRIKK
ncbi:hypothetical protein LCM10_04965 [Rossellomorea aquimaris]|uniref:DUF6946 family protein n=1 Tax=Rossellomorea aquimaris TaxID=189382 RepID=UPI001CD75C6E|nr:hypothetical protein [Rossellomorea aquimaris]MCA1054330.1 hypothetical protein [Rossellomorea aquimaris]